MGIIFLLAGTIAEPAATDETHPSHNAAVRRSHVLIVHSYYPTFTWTDRITEGIRGAFAESGTADVVLYFEHMDAKRHPGKLYLDRYAAMLAAKYPDPGTIDLIICSDDQAFNFFLDRADNLLPGVPMVFCAVNGYEPQRHSYPRPVTGVVEAIDPAATLTVALDLQPDLRRVLVVTDVTRTGRAIEQTAREAFAPFAKRVEFTYVSDLSMGELQQTVAVLPGRSIVFLFVFNRDNPGVDFTHEESLRLIAQRCSVPIYGPWTFYLGHGIVGGMLTSGEMQGRAAAHLALRILAGERADAIPVVTTSPNRYMFDHRQLVLHKLPLDRLPPGSEIINSPDGFYQKYRYQIWAGAITLAAQMAIIIMLMFNIGRRRQAEEALTASERRYRFLIETIRDVVFIIEPAGRLTYLNPVFETITGYSPGEFIGHPFTQILAPEDVASTVERFQRGLTGEEIPVYEVAVKHRQRGSTPIELKVTSLVDDNGRTIGRIGVARDIRERKEVEAEKQRLEGQLQRAQKMEAIGTLAGGVAHDLNNILSGIVSYPDLLLMQLPQDSALRKPVQTIRDSGQKAAAIVQDLLTLARRGVAGVKVVNLNRIVSDYLESPEFEKLKSYHPDVCLDVNLAPGLLNIMASPVHLAKALMNLVSNAAEAMPQGGTVWVTTENRYVDRPISGYDRVEEGDYAVLQVSDTGVGISVEDRERIFEPFYSKKVLGRSGTGLGMAVVWGTVKDLHGYIDIQSMVGQGTTFALYFPATREPAAMKKDAQNLDAYHGRGETILVIDDIETQREIATLMLAQLGYAPCAVDSGEAAVRYIRDHRVDLLVLDMIMRPGMDGLDTYKEILKINPGQRAIIASGFSETARVKEAQNLGAGRYLKKPYTMERLGMAVRQELDRGDTPPISEE